MKVDSTLNGHRRSARIAQRRKEFQEVDRSLEKKNEKPEREKTRSSKKRQRRLTSHDMISINPVLKEQNENILPQFCNALDFGLLQDEKNIGIFEKNMQEVFSQAVLKQKKDHGKTDEEAVKSVQESMIALAKNYRTSRSNLTKMSANLRKMNEQLQHKFGENSKLNPFYKLRSNPVRNSHSSEHSDCSNRDEISCAKAYISSSSSHKIAPGKRIKWRHAIREEDSVRQNLSIAFKDLK